MTVTALIKFTQGPNTDVAGRAVLGTLADGAATVTNGDNTDVARWQIDMLDVPSGSALPVGVLATATSNTPSANFVPDASGTYRLRLVVWNNAGVFNTDIRCFGVKDFRGFLVPPYQGSPDPISTLLKPNELNYGGQVLGWLGDAASGMHAAALRGYAKRVALPVYAAVSDIGPNTADRFLVFTASIGAPSTLSVLSTIGVGDGFMVCDAEGSADTNPITVALPAGHTFLDGTTSKTISSPGGGMEALHVSTILWQATAVNDAGSSGFTPGGDLGGTSVSQDVIGLQGNALSAGAPLAYQVLVWNTTGSTWQPGDTPMHYREDATPVYSQDARTSDAATYVFQLRGQSPFAGATGTNRNSGGFKFEIAPPAAGGTAGAFSVYVNTGTVFSVGDGLVSCTALGLGFGGNVSATGTLRMPYPSTIKTLDRAGNDARVFEVYGVGGAETGFKFGDETHADYLLFKTAGEFYFDVGAVTVLYASATWLSTNGQYLGFGSLVSSPTITQAPPAVDTAAQGLTMYAQAGGASSVGAGKTGGNTVVRGGLGGAGSGAFIAGAGGILGLAGGNAGANGGAGGNNGGAVQIGGGSLTGAGSVGKVQLGFPRALAVELGNTTDNPPITQIGTGLVTLLGNVVWGAAAVTPRLYHADASTADVVADDFTLGAQGVSAAGGTHAHAGNIGIRGGIASGNAANTDGNVWFHVSPGALADWHGLEKGAWVADAVSAPVAPTAGGGFLYSWAGGLTWLGSSGTYTTFASAAPHCKECGYDFWNIVCSNNRYDAQLMECGWCGHKVKSGPPTVLDRLTLDELASCI
jgi:hypothetical protein